MLHMLPEPREDELLYSFLARGSRYLQVPAAGSYMRELLGRRWGIASAGLPCHLAAIAAEIGACEQSAFVDQLVDCATLYPFHTAFLPSQLRIEARTSMVGSGSGLYTRLGLAAFRVPVPRRLRFCCDCLHEMLADYGDAWWRREHQIPGIAFCAKHGVPLRRSDIAIGDINRHSFIPATPDVCRGDAVPVIERFSYGDDERLVSLASLAVSVLKDPPAPLEFHETNGEYRARLSDLGLMRTAHRVDQPALAAAFRDQWGGMERLIPGLALGKDIEGSWLAGMVRKGRRAAHPLQHIMLRAVLDGLKTVPSVDPFGAGPWPCRNPISGHYDHRVIRNVRLRRDGEVIYGDFSCDCGYLYTQSCSSRGVLGKPKYRRFGPSLVPALKTAVARGDSLRSTAARFGLDPKTLMREAMIAGIAVPWHLSPSGRVPVPEPAKVKPRKRAAKRRPAKRDWRGIDQKLARAAFHAAKEILIQTPPIRVTKASLERNVAAKDWVQKRCRKLPRTSRVLRDLAETTEDFRARRLVWQAKQAFAAGDLRPCEILRKAGLPAAWLPKVKDMIEDARRNGRPIV